MTANSEIPFGGAGPDMMAIIKRTVFERHCSGLQLGDLLPWEGWDGQHAALDALRAGSRLFLVTVRPPDERLWLVCVYPGVQRVGREWRSVVKNSTPIVDITHLRPRLEFQSGKGLSQEKGKLGNSLQTPRILTAADVSLLEKAIEDQGFERPTYKGPNPSPGVPFVPPGRASSADLPRDFVAFLQAHDQVPLSPCLGEPEYDVAWVQEDTIFVAVVEALPAGEEDEKLQAILGRLLHIEHWFISFGFDVSAILVTSREPKDLIWDALCDSVGVDLRWPDVFESLFEADDDDADDDDAADDDADNEADDDDGEDAEEGADEDDENENDADQDDDDADDREERGRVSLATTSRSVDLRRDVMVFQLSETFGVSESDFDSLRQALIVVAEAFRAHASLRSRGSVWLAFGALGRPHWQGLSTWLGLSTSVPPKVLDFVQGFLEQIGAKVYRVHARPERCDLHPALCLGDEGLEILQTTGVDLLDEVTAEELSESGDIILRRVSYEF